MDIKEKKIKVLNINNRIKCIIKKYNTSIVEFKEENNINNYLELDNKILNYIIYNIWQKWN